MNRMALAVLAFACTASAAPAASFWDRARDPSTGRAEAALRVAVRSRFPRDIPAEILPAFDGLHALRAATLLEMQGGAAFEDAGVLCFLGSLLVTADRGRENEAIDVLRRCIRMDPPAPDRRQAWLDLATASGKVGDRDGEIAAFGEALRLEWDQNQRATIVYSRGGVHMLRGELRQARADFTMALETSTESDVHTLAAWGLAVVFAKDDDLAEALPYAWDASRIRFTDPFGNPVTALELPGVSFDPPRDVFYYRALGAMAAAEHETDDANRKMQLEWAVSQWHHYQRAAKDEGDRWGANVAVLIKWCERRLETLNAKPHRARP